MKTIGMTLALILGFVGITHAAEDMDTTLDRAVTLAEARGAIDKASAQPDAKRPAPRKPKRDTAKANATDTAGVFVATCNDGMRYYHATGERRGSCSGHQGVAQFADGSAPKSKGKRGSYR